MSKYHIFKHFHLINKHRFYVFCNAVKLGIPLRGMLHDLSKYSPTEFFNSAKYYKGTSSPVLEQRTQENCYSSISVHHIKHNKHHFEYWVDFYKGGVVLKPMPYKYSLEYIADVIAASKAYNRKNFDTTLPYNYFIERKNIYLMHTATKEFVTKCLKIYEENGFKALKKKTTKKLYNECLNHYKAIERIQIL